jgi:hypothetical protein
MTSIIGSFNEVEDIKTRLLLESENQTIPDQTIQDYLNEANQEVFDTIGRNHEREIFTGVARTFFPIKEIVAVYLDGDLLDEEDYTITENNQRIDVTSSYSELEVLYIPQIYVLYERAICIVNLMTRLNPTVSEDTSTVYLNWKNKQKTYLDKIMSKFGVGYAV